MERVQQDAHCKEGTDSLLYALNFYQDGNVSSVFLSFFLKNRATCRSLKMERNTQI